MKKTDEQTNQPPQNNCCESCGSDRVMLTEELYAPKKCADCGTARKK